MIENDTITTYQELAEKYTRREKVRSIMNIISGVAAITGGVLTLWQLREDRRGVLSTPGSKP